MKILLLVIQEVIETKDGSRIDHSFRVAFTMKPLLNEVKKRFGGNISWEVQAENILFSEISEKITATIVKMNADE